MRRQSQREVEEAAARRLELLRRELAQAGLSPVPEDPAPEDPVPEDPVTDVQASRVTTSRGHDGPALPQASRISSPGRHVRADPRGAASGPGARVCAAVADRLPETFRGRVALQPGPALVVVVLVAAAVLVGVVVLVRSGAQTRPVPPARVAALTTPATPATPLPPRSSPVAGGSRAPSAGAAAGSVTVDIAGKVRRPGVATLPAGSRVIDALKKAGGARGGADLTGLNLARVLVDGEQILVGRPPVPGGVGAGVASGAPQPTGALVNLNTATQDQLETLPGVGPVTAQKILQWRTDHGTFSSVDELLEIDGIGEKTFADLAPLVTL